MSPRTLADIRSAQTMVHRFWAYGPDQAFLYVWGVAVAVGTVEGLVHQHTAVYDAAVDTLCGLWQASMDTQLVSLFGGGR